MRLPLLAASAALALAAFAASAAPSAAATAYASDRVTIFGTPDTDYTQVVGLLQAGETVTLDTCTPDGAWCRVIHNGPTGWVLASYLIGAEAKVQASPGTGLTGPNGYGVTHHNR